MHPFIDFGKGFGLKPQHSGHNSIPVKRGKLLWNPNSKLQLCLGLLQDHQRYSQRSHERRDPSFPQKYTQVIKTGSPLLCNSLDLENPPGNQGSAFLLDQHSGCKASRRVRCPSPRIFLHFMWNQLKLEAINESGAGVWQPEGAGEHCRFGS